MPRTVIVISSVNRDTTFVVPHFPQPGETILSQKASTSLGGKGANVAIAAAHATGSVHLVAAVGPDAADEIATLKSHHVNTRFIEHTDIPTGRAVILVNATGENCIILSKGANAVVTAKLPPELEQLMNGALVVLQLEIEHTVTEEIAVMAERLGATIVFNPSPAPTTSSEVFSVNARVWKTAHILVLNEVEMEQISGTGRRQDAVDVENIWAKCIEELKKQCRKDVMIVVTLGKVGVVYYRDGYLKFVSAIEVNCVVDTTGAGDTFTGFLVAGLAEGQDFDQSIRMGVAAAALSVGRKGAAESIPCLEEVLELMH